MRVRVLLFGQLRDIVGRREDSLELPAGSTVASVAEHYRGLYPGFKAISPAIACALNQEYVPASAGLADGDEVGLLPPVSGGKSELGQLESPCAIVREPIA